MDENGIRGFLSSLCLRVPFLGLDPEERNGFENFTLRSTLVLHVRGTQLNYLKKAFPG